MPFPKVPPAGQVLMSDGTKFVGGWPPGILIARDDGFASGSGTPLNTTSETSVLNALLTSSVLGGALPGYVAAGDAVHVRQWGYAVFNTSGTLTLNMYAGASALGTGGTKIAAGATSGAITAARGYLLDLWIELLSATTVTTSGFIIPRGATGTGYGSGDAAQIANSDAGEPVTVSPLPLNLDIRAICSTGAATTRVTQKGTRVYYHPRNY